MKTIVIFRKFQACRGGDVIALFPCEPGTNDPRTCDSYMHVGQHSAADAALGGPLRLATPEEYAPLKAELESLGYQLDVRTRSCPAYFERRRKALASI